jgi:hypothetical protein
MNLPRRLRISLISLRILSARRRVFAPMALNTLVDRALCFMQASNERKFETFKKALASCEERNNALTSEIANLDRLPVDRKRQLLATSSALVLEVKHLQANASKWAPPKGFTLLNYMVTYLHNRAVNDQRKLQSLSRIISRVECDTFYWDLLLWAVVPGGCSEELLGDLNEEYLLRISTEGEASARAWYRHQVTATVGNYFWRKIERLAAIATLVDLLDRWFKH